MVSFHRRANSFAEEFRGGDMERECIEEVCTQDEMVEIFKAEDRRIVFIFIINHLECFYLTFGGHVIYVNYNF